MIGKRNSDQRSHIHMTPVARFHGANSGFAVEANYEASHLLERTELC